MRNRHKITSFTLRRDMLEHRRVADEPPDRHGWNGRKQYGGEIKGVTPSTALRADMDIGQSPFVS